MEVQAAEEDARLEKKRARELKDYEQVLQDQHEAELKRRQQKLQLSRESEDKELELVKLRIDQMYQD